MRPVRTAVTRLACLLALTALAACAPRGELAFAGRAPGATYGRYSVAVPPGHRRAAVEWRARHPTHRPTSS